MDNEIIEELKVFTEAQKEKMTAAINTLIEKRQQVLWDTERLWTRIKDHRDSIISERTGLEDKLRELLISWFFEEGSREEVDKAKVRIEMLKSLEVEIPLLEKEVTQRVERARRAGRQADTLIRKQQYFENVKRQLIDGPGKEPERLFINDLYLYAADLPGGKEMAKEFIAKLCELKYPNLQKAA